MSTNQLLDDVQSLGAYLEQQEDEINVSIDKVAQSSWLVAEGENGSIYAALTREELKDEQSRLSYDGFEALKDHLEEDARDEGRYGDLEMGDDETLIYDRHNSDSWVQSDEVRSLESMR